MLFTGQLRSLSKNQSWPAKDRVYGPCRFEPGEGAHLVLCDTLQYYASVPYPLSSADELARVADEIKALGQRVIAMHADVTDLNAMQQLANIAHQQLGPIDVVIANLRSLIQERQTLTPAVQLMEAGSLVNGATASRLPC